jgi:hypothetical protein
MVHPGAERRSSLTPRTALLLQKKHDGKITAEGKTCSTMTSPGFLIRVLAEFDLIVAKDEQAEGFDEQFRSARSVNALRDCRQSTRRCPYHPLERMEKATCFGIFRVALGPCRFCTAEKWRQEERKIAMTPPKAAKFRHKRNHSH